MILDKIDEIGLTPIVELLNQMHLPLNQYSNLWSVLAKVNKYITLDYLFSIRIYQDGKGILRISILKPERYYNMLSA